MCAQKRGGGNEMRIGTRGKKEVGKEMLSYV
jgi:hypothetical protein